MKSAFKIIRKTILAHKLAATIVIVGTVCALSLAPLLHTHLLVILEYAGIIPVGLVVEQLGGEEGAPNKINSYVNFPIFSTRNQRHAISILGYSSKPAIDTLIKILYHKKYKLRAKAAEKLARFSEDDRSIYALAEALSDPNNVVRNYATGSLSGAGVRAKLVLPTLLKEIRSPRASARSTIARILDNIGSEAREATPYLIDVLQNCGPIPCRATAAKTLGMIDPPPEDVIPALKEAFNHRDELLRSAAAETLEKISPEHDEFFDFERRKK